MKTYSRLVALLGLLALAYSVGAEDGYDEEDMYYDLDDNNTSTVAPSPTTPAGPPSTSTGTSTSGSPPVVSTTVAPTIPTPVNPNPMAYSLNDSNSTNVVCLSLTTAFKVVITEIGNPDKVNVTLAQNGEHGEVNRDESSCSIAERKATIAIEPEDKDKDKDLNFWLELTFSGLKDLWSMENFYVHYNSSVLFTTNSTLDANAVNISKSRSFHCRSLEFDFNTSNSTQYRAQVTLTSLKVQAFTLKNTTSGELGNGVSCTADASQNKIVPIAVGAALAGLVVVVLIAYLIGRLRSRKQSSYEALS